jgi:hypothetical protein
MMVFLYLLVLVSVLVRVMTLLREMIEAGIINYGKEFKHSMEEGGWDFQS